MIKVIFFDIDGTLISRNTKRIADSTFEALDKLRAKGIKLCVATGRAKVSVPDYFLDHFDLIVSLNGQWVYDRENTYIRHQLEEEDVRLLVDFALKKIAPVYFVVEDGYFVNYVNDQILAEVATHNIPMPRVDDPLRALEEPVYAASVFLDPEGEIELLSKARNLEGTRWDDMFFDVVLKGLGKHTALIEVCEYFGIDPKQSMAIGDGGNDISMLKAAGIGVAMGNANDDVKAAADYVTDDEDNDGIMKALKHFRLI